MNEKIELVICTEEGYLESLSKLLVYSIRKFGGAFKDIPIYSYQPRKNHPISASTRSFFEDHHVEHIDLHLNTVYADYPLANKPLVCEHRERHSKSDVIVFMDSDILFQHEPNDFLTIANADVLLRPVDTKNVGTDGQDENAEYWKKLYRLCDVKIRRDVRSTIDNQTLLEYYNSGQIVNHKSNGLFSHWKENFIKTMDARLMPSQGIFFVEQSVFAATIAQLELSVKQIDKHYNCPVHMLDHVQNESYKIESFSNLVTLHYHKIFQEKDHCHWILNQFNSYENGRILSAKMKEFGVIPQRNYFKSLLDYLKK